MSSRTIAIRLKIPDNEAYTALTALRRLGVDLSRLERAEIWTFEDGGSDGDFVERVERNETLFNPNKHELHILDEGKPRAGEAWIETLRETEDGADDLARIGRPVAGVSAGRRYVGWRLFSDGHTPADAPTVRAAVEKLLCNPAIERAILS
jgi:phosphoribosylformylglycinamidine (FGAM) synthase PurS component